MDSSEHLSPEHIATLLDLAKKIESRKSRQAISGAVVKRHDWTREQRKLHAAKNDLKSAQFVYEKTREAKESAEEAHSYALRDLEAAEVRIKDAIAAMEAITES